MWLKSGQKNVVSLESLQREGEAFPGDDLLTGRSEKGKKIQDRTSQGDALYSVFLHFLEREQTVLEAMPEALSPSAATSALQRPVCGFPTCQLQRESIQKSWMVDIRYFKYRKIEPHQLVWGMKMLNSLTYSNILLLGKQPISNILKNNNNWETKEK